LFNPDPSGVDLQNPSSPPPAGSWRAKLLDLGTIVGLATTDWNAGGITRTILSLLSLALNAADQIVSTDLQGGFLDWASSVTDDPASLGTAAIPGWLDALADGNYNVQRLPAKYARGTLTFTNTSVVTYGPFTPGSYHAADPTTGATYSNVNSLTLAPGVTSAIFQADLAGSASSATPGQITGAVTALLGVSVTNAASFVGANPESNAGLVARCRAKLSSLSPNGPPDAYNFFARSAFSLLAAMTPSIAMSQPVTRTLVQSNSQTGDVAVYLANASGAVVGLANTAVTGATNATPILLNIAPTVASPPLNTGDWVYISGVQGNTAANGFFQITANSPTTFFLNGSAGNGAYTGGGILEGGDLGLVDFILHANVVPLGIFELTVAAGQTSVTVAVTVYVPASAVQAAPGIIQTAIAQYFAAAPIGGYVTGVPIPNTIPVQGLLSSITQALFANKIVATDASGTLNGSTADLAIGPTNVAVLSGTPVVTVIGS
jgi:hypothetical protein